MHLDVAYLFADFPELSFQVSVLGINVSPHGQMLLRPPGAPEITRGHSLSPRTAVWGLHGSHELGSGREAFVLFCSHRWSLGTTGSQQKMRAETKMQVKGNGTLVPWDDVLSNPLPKLVLLLGVRLFG